MKIHLLINCQFDINNSLIRCIYPYGIFKYPRYQEIYLSDKNYTLITRMEVDNKSNLNCENIVFSFSKNIVFTCFSESDNIKCYFRNNLNDQFQIISYDFENQCSEPKTYYFKEKNQFILSCKKSPVHYLYLFNEDDMNNIITEKTFTLENYNGKYSIIYNLKTDDYDIIYDGNFTEACEEINKEEQSSFITTNGIKEIIKSTNMNIFETTKKDDEPTNLYKYLSDTILKTKISHSKSNSDFFEGINIRQIIIQNTIIISSLYKYNIIKFKNAH